MVTKSAKPRGVTEGLQIELGGLFSTLGSAVDLLGELAKGGAKHVQHSDEVTLEGLDEGARGVYGFSIRTGRGGAGAASVKPLGNIPAPTEGVVAAEVHEPLVDVFDEGCEIVITAVLPGVREDEITIEQRDAVLAIASHGERRYAKEVLLPGAIDGSSLQKKCNNGVLEIRARKV